MFKLTAAATYWWPVSFRVPSADKPGKWDTAEFEAQFRYLSNEEHNALLAEIHEKRMSDRQVAPRVVADFRGVTDDNGDVVVFNAAALDKLTNMPGVDSAIARAYFDSRTEAPAKN